MATASDALRAQLVDIAGRLLAASTQSTGWNDAASIKEDLSGVVTMLALFQSDVRQVLEQAVNDLDTSDPSSLMSALSLVARASAALTALPASQLQAPLSPPPPPPAAPSIPTRTFLLPIELLTHILDLVHPLTEYKERQRSNMSMALVSRAFYRAASAFLNSELHITNAKQLLGLQELLEDDEDVLDDVRIITLDFDFTALLQSIDEDEYGRTWLAPVAKQVLRYLTKVEDLTFGLVALKSVGQAHYIDYQFYDHLKMIGVDLDHMPIKNICIFLPPREQRRHVVNSVVWNSPWNQFERVTVLSCGDEAVSDDMAMDTRDPNGAWPLKSLVAPALKMTFENLKWLLDTSTDLRRLEFTLHIPSEEYTIPRIAQGLEMLFDRLTSLEHLSLRLTLDSYSLVEEVTDRIMAHIADLSHLRSLTLGGHFDFAENDEYDGRISFARALEGLQITHFTIDRVWTLFTQDMDPECRLDLATVLEESEDNFSNLQSLTIFYTPRQWILIDLPVAAADRGIVLRLCRAAG